MFTSGCFVNLRLITTLVVPNCVKSLPGSNKMSIMHYRFTFVIAVTISMMIMINSTHSEISIKGTQRYSMSGRGKNGDVFNLLLGLYKLNPLRSSKVYQAFSEHVLSGHNNRKDHVDIHFDSNESGKKRVKIDLNELEKVIHIRSKKPIKRIQKPEYNLDSVDIENFTVDVVMNRKMNDQFSMNHDDSVDIYSSIFGHLNSNEIEDDIPVTKLLPVNDTQVRNHMVNEVSSKYLEGNKAADDFDSLVEDHNEIRDRRVMSDKLGTGDVIVL